MSKKILAIGSVLAVLAGIAALSAFEAHIINVTAHIENALDVHPEAIEFGTVFPQEYLERQFTVELSSSFQAAERVDDVEYVIKQKPKCKRTTLCPPIGVDPDCSLYAPVDYATHECPENYAPMESLCPFLSKLPVDMEVGDVGVPSYYVEDDPDYCDLERSIDHARGVLAKSDQDTSDSWTIDLKVPPVEGYVGQDWPAGCPVVEENDIDYGCDLWVEITNISLPGDNGICEEKPDVMQVFDRSGSIDSTELNTLKTAANAFVTALNPQTDGAHMGQSSFADTGSLDLHLTSDLSAITGAINGLTTGGLTNLYEGIDWANKELGNLGYFDADDRDDNLSPDFMVIITDGNPNQPPTGDPIALAEGAANAADAAGTTIYVVGIGTTSGTADWLKNNIATSPAHYFDATDWSQLQAILEGLASCQ